MADHQRPKRNRDTDPEWLPGPDLHLQYQYQRWHRHRHHHQRHLDHSTGRQQPNPDPRRPDRKTDHDRQWRRARFAQTTTFGCSIPQSVKGGAHR